ncbi:MAG: hypothetical protein OXH86_10795 [Acidimicrobiaceae bacterium]|nr:hypothetical protein [Acidimicrobiaceae bacterium]MDE0497832.1 hypothetical protein [Acidimicrobiaceae bacterium]
MPHERSGDCRHWTWELIVTPPPVVHDLKALDTELLGDLGRADELIDVNAAAHTRIVTHDAY